MVNGPTLDVGGYFLSTCLQKKSSISSPLHYIQTKLNKKHSQEHSIYSLHLYVYFPNSRNRLGNIDRCQFEQKNLLLYILTCKPPFLHLKTIHRTMAIRRWHNRESTVYKKVEDKERSQGDKLPIKRRSLLSKPNQTHKKTQSLTL